MLNPETLPQQVQDELKRIANRRPEELTEDEAKFLKARRDYLRPEQEAVFMGVLEGTITPKPNPVKETIAVKKEPIDPDKMKLAQLEQMVKDAGVELPPTTKFRSKKELADALNEHLGLTE